MWTGIIIGTSLVALGRSEEGVAGTKPICTDDRPFWLSKFRACVECVVSTDCVNEAGEYAGQVCYMGECKDTCPAGMYVTEDKLVRKYYVDLDAAIDDKLVWEAFPPETTDGAQEAVKKEYEAFVTANWNKGDDYNIDEHGVSMNVCRCNEENDYFKASQSFTLGHVIGSSFSDACTCNAEGGWCESQFNLELLGVDVGSQALVPNGRPANCWGMTDQSNWLLVSLSTIAVIIAIFAYRSSSNLLWDFHRLNLFNILGTWAFVVMFVIKDPHFGGYNRFLGVGIFAHNAAEWNIMIRLWFGNSLTTRQMLTWWNIIYIAVMMVIIMTLPLTGQLVFAGAAGATLDTTFVLMCLSMFHQFRNETFFSKGRSGFTVTIFMIAYLFHFVALIFAFNNCMSEGNMTITVWTTVLVFSILQFIMLQFFAYNQSNRAVWCGPYAQSSYNMKQVGDKDYKYRLIEDQGTLSTAHDEVAATMITHAEVQLSDTAAGKAQAPVVRENGIFPEGLNEAGQNFPECGCLPLESRRRCNCCWMCPFAVYIGLGAVLATITNIQLFLLGPAARFDSDSLVSGICPQYYPIPGNGEAPAWIEEMTTDSNWLRHFGDEVTGEIGATLQVVGFGIIIIMLSIMTCVSFVQVESAGGANVFGRFGGSNKSEEDQAKALI